MTSLPSKRKRQSTKVVNFNVGGQHFTISRSLLEMHPETMLAKSASEQWQDDPEAEIFIERDGELFRHVLSYLRDGRVKLPLTLTKEGFLSELEYYGLDNICEENVDDSLIKEVQTAQGFSNGKEKMEIMIDTLKRERYCVEFAQICIEYWLSDDSKERKKTFIIKEDDDKTYLAADAVYENDYTHKTYDKCNEYLKKVGLFLQDIKYIEDYFIVEVILYDPAMAEKKILVSGAGTDAVNGIYNYAGTCGSATQFKKRGVWEHSDFFFTLHLSLNHWYLAIKDELFYESSATRTCNKGELPFNKTWEPIGKGISPPPTVTLKVDSFSNSKADPIISQVP